MIVLVTGAAGFLGYHVAARLLSEGCRVFGIDNLNGYYDPRLKRARLERLHALRHFEFCEMDVACRAAMESLFEKRGFDATIHLAAQAGVRYSIENPHLYAESNLTGFLHVLEGARRGRAGHLIYASSSSVYGGNTKVPFSVSDRCDRPVSFYAATKRANELMAHSYAHLFGIACTGLRFFTVYGPWGRPDMAPYRFAQAIERGERMDIYNYGRMQRDFTYVDDIVEGVVRLAQREASGPRLFNIGGSRPVGLMDFVRALESALGKRAPKRFMPMQKGDVRATHADVEDLVAATGFRPATPLETGVARFVSWFREWTGLRAAHSVF
ncbi:MAG TPA: NAD-dependent epimerase/dehydratase family protein [Bryobacteraceae bacterium]|nr:NAD-dependent epimerase/dehydratase family protein [Bryobacteraceae bacterium]